MWTILDHTMISMCSGARKEHKALAAVSCWLYTRQIVTDGWYIYKQVVGQCDTVTKFLIAGWGMVMTGAALCLFTRGSGSIWSAICPSLTAPPCSRSYAGDVEVNVEIKKYFCKAGVKGVQV